MTLWDFLCTVVLVTEVWLLAVAGNVVVQDIQILRGVL